MNQIPESFQGSGALQLVLSQGWDWKVSTLPNIILGKCPYCGKSDHCYMEVHGTISEQKNRDGLYLCQRCGKSGNLYSLKQHLGIVTPGIQSQKEWANNEKQIDPLPDIEACHEALLKDDDALEYLTQIRGFSIDIIQKQKLGISKHYFKATGKDTKALVFPYLVNGNAVWVHYRTLPDPKDLVKIPKDFASPKGWDAVLYNGENLREGLKDAIFVEGEANVIAALDKGINNIFGVPGANIKKAEWIDKLDQLNLERIYICYDKDKVGQKAAQTLASRIGIEKCWKILLPEFEVTTESGETRKGKDLNEWFINGGTKESFNLLLQSAVQFGVDGVSIVQDALDEFEEELDFKGAQSKYNWPLLQDFIQFEDGDVFDVIAEEKIGKTTFAMNMMEYLIDTYGEDGIYIGEMTNKRMARKWIAMKAGIADNPPKNDEEAKQLTQLFKDAIPAVKKLAANREGNIYFCHPKFSNMDDIYKLIIDCIRRYNVKFIIIDNLQYFCDTTIGGKNRTQWLSEISKRLVQINKDYDRIMIRILQPHRISGNALTTVKDTDGASQIAKDCDGSAALNRNRVGEISKDVFAQGAYIKTEGVYGPEMLVTVGLTRYSSGGTITLYYNGATSTVHSLTEGKIAAMQDNYQKQSAGILQSGLDSLKQIMSQDKSIVT